MNSKKFSLEAILTFSHDVMCAHPSEWEPFFNFMYQNIEDTLGPVGAGDRVKEAILAQHPQLREIDAKTLVGKQNKATMKQLKIKYGEMLELTPIEG